MNSRHLTRIEAKENSDKNEKSLYKLMSTAMYGKIMEKFRSRTNVRLINNKKKRLFKIDIKTKLWQWFSCKL